MDCVSQTKGYFQRFCLVALFVHPWSRVFGWFIGGRIFTWHFFLPRAMVNTYHLPTEMLPESAKSQLTKWMMGIPHMIHSSNWNHLGCITLYSPENCQRKPLKNDGWKTTSDPFLLKWSRFHFCRGLSSYENLVVRWGVDHPRDLPGGSFSLPGDGSRIPWLTKQADANALSLAPEGVGKETLWFGEDVWLQNAFKVIVTKYRWWCLKIHEVTYYIYIHNLYLYIIDIYIYFFVYLAKLGKHCNFSNLTGAHVFSKWRGEGKSPTKFKVEGCWWFRTPAFKNIDCFLCQVVM